MRGRPGITGLRRIFGRTQWNYDGTKLGFTGPTGLQGIGIPKIGFSNYASWGNSQDDLRPKEDYELSADLSKTVNKHFLRIGARAAQIREGYDLRANFLGSLSFTTGYTQRNAQQSDTTSGNDFASFLLGYPSGGNVDNNGLLEFNMDQVGLYIQDDFKVTPKLTLNFGLRWDVQTPQTENHNRMDIGFNPTVSYPLGSTTAMGALMFASSGNRDALQHSLPRLPAALRRSLPGVPKVDLAWWLWHELPADGCVPQRHRDRERRVDRRLRGEHTVRGHQRRRS